MTNLQRRKMLAQTAGALAAAGVAASAKAFLRQSRQPAGRRDQCRQSA
ncbi:hypothetical protein BCC0238_006262 [Burkholderia gladioli]|nr:hypothetical protein [Burkholderia gladioli]